MLECVCASCQPSRAPPKSGSPLAELLLLLACTDFQSHWPVWPQSHWLQLAPPTHTRSP